MRKVPRSLFWCTVCAFAALSSVAFFMAEAKLPPQVEVKVDGQPKLGDPEAPVQVVLFEEPKCPMCKRFTEQVFPRIKENYIDTNKINFTIVPVSFLKNSMPAAMALLCVYNQDRKLFFTYLDYIYRNQPDENQNWATPENLERMAKAASPSINIAKLKRCFDDASLKAQVVSNTNYGNELMGHLITPTIYVSGMKADDVSFDTVSKLIEAALKKGTP